MCPITSNPAGIETHFQSNQSYVRLFYIIRSFLKIILIRFRLYRNVINLIAKKYILFSAWFILTCMCLFWFILLPLLLQHNNYQFQFFHFSFFIRIFFVFIQIRTLDYCTNDYFSYVCFLFSFLSQKFQMLCLSGSFYL